MEGSIWHPASTTLYHKNPSTSWFKWLKEPFIGGNPLELPAGDRRWQENESSDSTSTPICFPLVLAIMKNILMNWGKVIPFACSSWWLNWWVDEATSSGVWHITAEEKRFYLLTVSKSLRCGQWKELFHCWWSGLWKWEIRPSTKLKPRWHIWDVHSPDALALSDLKPFYTARLRWGSFA